LETNRKYTKCKQENEIRHIFDCVLSHNRTNSQCKSCRRLLQEPAPVSTEGRELKRLGENISHIFIS
jgi:hypothetical protein